MLFLLGKNFRNKGKKVILLVDPSFTTPLFETVLPNLKSCREVEFIIFPSNMQQIIIANNKLKKVTYVIAKKALLLIYSFHH